jgi:hypothetical protein
LTGPAIPMPTIDAMLPTGDTNATEIAAGS